MGGQNQMGQSPMMSHSYGTTSGALGMGQAGQTQGQAMGGMNQMSSGIRGSGSGQVSNQLGGGSHGSHGSHGSNQSLMTLGGQSNVGSIGSSMGSSIGSNMNNMSSNSTLNSGLGSNYQLYQSQLQMKSPNMASVNSNNPGNTNRSPSLSSNATSSPSLNVSSIYYKDKRDNDLEKYRLQLNLKSQIIVNLKKKLEAANDTSEPQANEKFYKLYLETTTKLESKTQELNKVNEMFEALLVSLSINGNSVGLHDVDEQELTHKIVSKINYLTLENENLLKMVSHSNKLSLLIELGLLKNEVKGLQLKLDKYEKK